MPAEIRWVARLRPMGGRSIRFLLELPLGLDVWQREGDALVVAAIDTQLVELERRNIARVERIETVDHYVKRHEAKSTSVRGSGCTSENC